MASGYSNKLPLSWKLKACFWMRRQVISLYLDVGWNFGDNIT